MYMNAYTWLHLAFIDIAFAHLAHDHLNLAFLKVWREEFKNFLWVLFSMFF